MSRRTDAARRVLNWLVRGGLLLAWSLTGWGTLLLLATLAGVVTDGPGVAFARLVPVRGASLWTWLNGLSVVLALGAWLVGGAFFVQARRRSAEEPDPDPDL